ncbi:hypothetical protein ACFVZ0_12880, partial [Streptomyces prasinus]|uniref:hypothetical protein n=1 Tax=Streptomyces prasinus TaxID=67345 RepID=UPI0036CFBF8A
TPNTPPPEPAPRPATASVPPGAVRRRIGGNRGGAEAGRRDVEVEIAEETDPHRPPSTEATATSEEAPEGTVEEATS